MLVTQSRIHIFYEHCIEEQNQNSKDRKNSILKSEKSIWVQKSPTKKISKNMLLH